MNIRQVLRLSCLTVASLFWASCDGDSNSQAPEAETPDPDSSADAAGPASSDSETVSSAAEEASSSSSEAASSPEASSGASSAEAKSSSSVASEGSSSSRAEKAIYLLAKDTTVTCEKDTYTVSACSSTKSLTCDDYKRYLASDTSLSQKLLTEWEQKLQNCGAIQEMVALYGIIYNVCNSTVQKTVFTCSNDSTYEKAVQDARLVYANVEEYNEAHGISSSSVAESSSSEPEDVVQNCPQEGFVLFAEILAEVQKELYQDIVQKLEQDTTINEITKKYLEEHIDREKKTLKGGSFAPYEKYDADIYSFSLKGETEYWFDGYVAKTKTCAGGASVTTERYQELHDGILRECSDLIWSGDAP